MLLGVAGRGNQDRADILLIMRAENMLFSDSTVIKILMLLEVLTPYFLV